MKPNVNRPKQASSEVRNEVQELDSDYKDAFLRRLASDMQYQGVAANELKRRFRLTKETLDILLPEYKLLLSRFDLSLYSYCQAALTARYLHSKRIDSDQIIETSSSSHNIIEVDEAAAAAATEAHNQRWQEMQNQQLHKAGRAQLDSVMEVIRAEERAVLAFPEDVVLDRSIDSIPAITDATEAIDNGGAATITGDRGISS